MTGKGIGHGAHTTSGLHDSNLGISSIPALIVTVIDAGDSEPALKGAPPHMARLLPLGTSISGDIGSGATGVGSSGVGAFDTDPTTMANFPAVMQHKVTQQRPTQNIRATAMAS
jgi:hypothetical protein